MRIRARGPRTASGLLARRNPGRVRHASRAEGRAARWVVATGSSTLLFEGGEETIPGISAEDTNILRVIGFSPAGDRILFGSVTISENGDDMVEDSLWSIGSTVPTPARSSQARVRGPGARSDARFAGSRALRRHLRDQGQWRPR